MKALKDCKWEVEVLTLQDKYFWIAQTTPLCDIEWGELVGERRYTTTKGAINNWQKFAELNGITNYKVID